MKAAVQKRTFCILLSFVLVFAMAGTPAAMAGEAEPEAAGEAGTTQAVTVTSFAALPGEIAAQTAAQGTALESLALPTVLNAQAAGQDVVIENMTWTSDPAYDGTAAGVYTFTAVLPEGYALAEGTLPPVLTVTVTEAETAGALPSESAASTEPSAAPSVTSSASPSTNAEGGMQAMGETAPMAGETVTIDMSTVSAGGDGYVYISAPDATGSVNIWDASKSYIITGSTTTKCININIVHEAFNITLQDATIDLSTDDNVCAFNVSADAVNLTLVGNNTLKSGPGSPGILVSPGKSLAVTAASTGNLTVKGGSDCAGIGGASAGSAGTIRIDGGTIDTQGGIFGAGIGGGFHATGGTVTVTGGNVIAKGGEYGAGIGGGYQGAGGATEISGGNVTVTGDTANTAEDIGMGGDYISSSGTLAVSGGAVLTLMSGGTGAGAGSAAHQFADCTVTGAGANSHAGKYDADGRKIVEIESPANALGYTWDSTNKLVTINDNSCEWVVRGTKITTPNHIMVLGTGEFVVTLENAWIDTSATAGICAFEIAGTASARLMLTESARLKSGENRAGLEVPLGTSLTVREGSTGGMAVSGGKNAAGIGGMQDSSAGTITIKGGVVIVAGGIDGAGIGGGSGGSGGEVKITGGNVDVIGSPNGAGIGGGSGGAGGTIEITGGTVNALADSGAGMGGGLDGPGGNIKITGGNVTAESGSGAGMGGGSGGQGGFVEITGGTVNATSTVYGAGMGGGFGREGGAVTISGGNVTANGGTAGGVDKAEDTGHGYFSADPESGVLTVYGKAVLTLGRGGTAADCQLANCTVTGAGAGSHAGVYPKAPIAISLAASPATVNAGGSTTVTATLTGKLSRIPVSGTMAVFDYEDGAIGISTIDGSGTATISWDNIPGGNHSVTAVYLQGTNDNYTTGTVTDAAVTSNRYTQAALAITGVPGSLQVGMAPFTIGTSGGSGSGAVMYSVSGDALSVDGSGRVTINHGGSATITATKAQDDIYSAASATVTLTVEKIPQQALTISGMPDTLQAGGSFTIGTSGGSGSGAVTYSVSGDALSVDAAGKVTLKKAGAATVTATKAGDESYNPATASVLVNVSSAPQSGSIGVNDIDWSGETLQIDLTNNRTVSAEVMQRIASQYPDRDIVIVTNEYTLTFPAGSFTADSFAGVYDFGAQINNGGSYEAIRALAGGDFVLMIHYNYSGALPGKASIRLYAGTQYAGTTLYYSYFNPATGTFGETQAATVDAQGYITVSQTHCSDYVLTLSAPSGGSPKTGDGTNLLLLPLLLGIGGALFAAAVYVRKRIARKQ